MKLLLVVDDADHFVVVVVVVVVVGVVVVGVVAFLLEFVAPLSPHLHLTTRLWESHVVHNH